MSIERGPANSEVLPLDGFRLAVQDISLEGLKNRQENVRAAFVPVGLVGGELPEQITIGELHRSVVEAGFKEEDERAAHAAVKLFGRAAEAVGEDNAVVTVVAVENPEDETVDRYYQLPLDEAPLEEAA